MAAHSSVHAWEIPWTEKPGGLQSTGSQDLDMTEHLRHMYNSRLKGFEKTLEIV